MKIINEELYQAQVEYLYRLVENGMITEEGAKAQIELLDMYISKNNK